MCNKQHTCGECSASQWVKCTVEQRKEHIAQMYAKAAYNDKKA